MDENSAPANGEVKKGDQHVTYVYKKKEVTPPVTTEYKVTHEFKSGTKGKELPKEVKALLPADQTGKKDGEKVTPTQPAKTEVAVEGGKWVFKNYDKKDATIDKADEHFVGTWVFEEDKTPEPKHVVTKYVDEKGNPINLEEKGKKNKKDIPAYEYVKTYTDKDGNTIHVYRLKQNPTPSIETRYVDENGNQLLPPKEGTNDPENIDGYTLINTGKDENGNTIHTYSKKPTEGVETRFVDTDGNQILADKAGTHDPSLINGYKFVRTQKDEQGNTTHIYKKLPTPAKEVVTKFLDENGNELASPLKGRNPSKEIPGYEILRTETDSDGNIIYVYRRKAPESQKVTKFVDEKGNEISKSTKGDNPKKDIDGYEFVKTTTDKDGNTVHIYKKKTTTPTTDVVTEYVDEKGKTIAPMENGTKDKKDIEGYEFVKTTTDDKGNIKHIYKKKTTTPTTNVVTEYVDEKGKTIAPQENGTKDKKDIPGYEFVKTEKDEKGNTKHIYKKKTTTPTVDKITKFVDENGKEISKSTKGDNPKKDIDGYEFLKTEKDKDGNTVHIYKKKTTTPTVDKITKFVDENGKEISKSTKGDNPKKDIDGYEFVKTEKDKDGNTVHIYKKKENTSKVVTKFVDEKGNPIAESEDGKKAKKDIEGYEFVKTTTDKDGNTVHIYKKKTNTRVIIQGNRTINSSSPNKKGTLVNTGDGVNASTYAIMMLAIGAVLTAIGIRKKKKEA